MCDYAADPAWRRDDGVGLSLQDVPLKHSTREALRRWAQRFDARLDQACDPTPEEELDFDAEGRRLWLRVREELGPTWEVSYYSDAQERRLD
jgi:hypothetical protein